MTTFESYAKKYGTYIAFAVALLIWLFPTPEGMSITQHKLLSIFSGAIILWITTSVSFATSVFILVPILYFWVGNIQGTMRDGSLVRSPAFALSGFSSSALWLLITGFIISIAMVETGIARRTALHLIKIFGKTPSGAILAPMFANLLVAPFTPSNTARTVAMLPIVEGIAETYGAEKGTSNFGKSLFISNMFASSITAGGFITATIPNPISIGLIIGAMGAASVQTSWAFWALAALPTTIIVLIGTQYIVSMLYKPEMDSIPGGSEFVKKELEKLGSMSSREVRALLYFLTALGLWSTDMLHGLNSGMVAFFVSALILSPGIGVLEWKNIQKLIPWDLFIFFGGVITLSNAIVKTKAFEFVIRSCIDAMGITDMNMTLLMVALMGFTIFSHIIWSTTTAMASVMIPIYIGIAQTFGYPIVGFVLPQAILMGYAFFLPFNTMSNIIMIGAGYFTLGEQFKSAMYVGLFAWVVWAITAIVWFPLIGLL